MQILASNEEGLTVRQLRQIIGQFQETDADGDEALVYIAVGNLHVSIGTVAAMDADGDMVLVPDHAQQIMEELGSWEEFTDDDGQPSC